MGNGGEEMGDEESRVLVNLVCGVPAFGQAGVMNKINQERGLAVTGWRVTRIRR